MQLTISISSALVIVTSWLRSVVRPAFTAVVKNSKKAATLQTKFIFPKKIRARYYHNTNLNKYLIHTIRSREDRLFIGEKSLKCVKLQNCFLCAWRFRKKTLNVSSWKTKCCQGLSCSFRKVSFIFDIHVILAWSAGYQKKQEAYEQFKASHKQLNILD